METPLAIFITALVFFCRTVTSAGDLRYRVELEENLVLRWGVDYEATRIYFELSAEVLPSQRVIFGFSDYGEPTQADLTVVGAQFGKVYLKVRTT